MDELDVKIILALADNRMNVCEVARILFMHRNTVSYRINRIRRKTGLDPLNFYDLYGLALYAEGERTWQDLKPIR